MTIAGGIVSTQAAQSVEAKLSGEVVKASQIAVTIKDDKGKIHKLRLSKDTKVEGELKPGSKVEATIFTTKVVRTDVKSISVKASEIRSPQSLSERQAAPVIPSSIEAPQRSGWLSALEDKDMDRVVIQKVVVFRLRGSKVVCNNAEVLKFYETVGVLHFDGGHYFPKDGRKCLEAIYDSYFLSQVGVGYPDENPEKCTKGDHD